MTRDETKRLIEHAKQPVCGRIIYDATGSTIFAKQSSNFTRLLQISAIGLSVFSARAQQHMQSSITMLSDQRCSTKVTVLDPSGAVVPGALIVITQIAQNEIKGATNPYGTFQADLPVGQYTLRVEAPGFATYVNPHLTLACMGDRQLKEVSVTLNVAWVGTIVEVKHYSPIRRFWTGLKALIAHL